MSDSSEINPEADSPTSDNQQQEAPDIDVADPQDVDPADGTDDEDKPVDNPAG